MVGSRVGATALIARHAVLAKLTGVSAEGTAQTCRGNALAGRAVRARCDIGHEQAPLGLGLDNRVLSAAASGRGGRGSKWG